MMKPRIDFTGFHFRTDRVSESIEDLVEEFRRTCPDLREVAVQIRRSFFGSYSTRFAAKFIDRTLESDATSGDPIEAVERCLGSLKSNHWFTGGPRWT